MNLESGKTIIAKTTGTENGKTIPVEIIYISETEGRINTQDGNTMVISGDRYQKWLNKYKEAQKAEERKKQLSSVIPTSANDYEQPEANHILFEEDDEDDDFPFEEDDEEPVQEQKAAEATQLAVVPVSKKSEKKKKEVKDVDPEASKLPKKNIKIAMIILIIVVVITLIFVLLPKIMSKERQQPTQQEQQNTETYSVAVLKADLEQGSALAEENIEEKLISAADYESLSRTVFVSPDGESYTGTVVAWKDATSLFGKHALRTLSAGDVLMAEDFEMADANGAVVSEPSSMQMRIVAIVSSDQLEEDLMFELGRYIFSSGQLQDVLNAQSESMLPAETEAETESESK